MERMEIYHLPTKLMQIVDNTIDGVLMIKHDPEYLKRALLHTDTTRRPTHEEAVRLADYMFSISQGFVSGTKPCTSKAFIARLDPVVEANPGKPGSVMLMANTCAFLGLPGISPDKEIAEFKSMLMLIKSTLEACFELDKDATEPTFHVFNSNSKFLEGLDFARVPDKGLVKECTDNAQRELRNMIRASPALMGWLKHQRRMLNAIGPHAWFTIQTDDFYEDRESPSSQYRSKKRQLEREAAATANKPSEPQICVPLDF